MSTDAANEANRLARDAQERQLRPYVAFSEAPEEDRAPFSRASKVHFTIKNFGQTPASNVRLTVGSTGIAQPCDDWSVSILDKGGDYGLLAPGDFRTDAISVRDFALDEVADVIAKKVTMLLRLRLDYSWHTGTDHHDLTLILADPSTNAWKLLNEDSRQKLEKHPDSTPN